MHTHIKVIKTYETRDGQQYDNHDAAVRHEYHISIPTQVSGFLKSGALNVHDMQLTEQESIHIAEAIFADVERFISILQDYVEYRDAVVELDEQKRNHEARNEFLRSNGLPEIPVKALHALPVDPVHMAISEHIRNA
jgi:hypothetical protein